MRTACDPHWRCPDSPRSASSSATSAPARSTRFKTVLDLHRRPPDAATDARRAVADPVDAAGHHHVKYVDFAMRIDNDGEGGILALMSLLGVKKHHRPIIVAARPVRRGADLWRRRDHAGDLGAFGARRREQIAPSLQPFVLPAAVAILFALFAVAAAGTARIGAAFGPIMVVWFVAIGGRSASGGIAQHPSVLAALNPLYGVATSSTGGTRAFSCWAASSSASPAPRRSMPTWATSARRRSASPGTSSSFPA